MSRASKIGLLFAVFLGIAVGRAPELLADTLVLKDGRTIETTILNEETDYIEVERHGASMLYLTEQIERIERSGSEAEQVVVGVSPSAQSPMAAEAADSGTSDGPEAAYRAYLESFKQGDVDGTRQRRSPRPRATRSYPAYCRSIPPRQRSRSCSRRSWWPCPRRP